MYDDRDLGVPSTTGSAYINMFKKRAMIEVKQSNNQTFIITGNYLFDWIHATSAISINLEEKQYLFKNCFKNMMGKKAMDYN